METIKNYLENLFSTLPRTREILQLKDDMSANMEDKYNQLKADGSSENEAIGIVISEFGNIEEIMAELGVSINSNESQNLPILNNDDVEMFFIANKKANFLDAIGVFLCIIGAASVVGLTQLGTSSPVLGVVSLLFFVAIATGLFIYSSYIEQPFDYIKKSPFLLTPSATDQVNWLKNIFRKQKAVGEIGGIIGILLGVILLLLSSSFNYEYAIILGLLSLLALVGLGVGIMIITSADSDACSILLKTADYSSKRKKANQTVNTIGSIWWPLSTAIFLIWGFFGPGGFGRSWIVWPVSGILFGILSSVYSPVTGINEDNQD